MGIVRRQQVSSQQVEWFLGCWSLVEWWWARYTDVGNKESVECVYSSSSVSCWWVYSYSSAAGCWWAKRMVNQASGKRKGSRKRIGDQLVSSVVEGSEKSHGVLSWKEARNEVLCMHQYIYKGITEPSLHTQGISCVVRGVVSFRLLGVVKVNVAWLMAIWGVN